MPKAQAIHNMQTDSKIIYRSDTQFAISLQFIDADMMVVVHTIMESTD